MTLRREDWGLLELPTMPRLASVALEAARHTDGVELLSEALLCAPAQLAVLLGVANSAAGRGVLRPERVRTVHEAIGLLGVTYAASIVVAVALRPTRPPPRTRRAVGRVWREALATAAWSRILSIVSARRSRDAFLCGLLHPLGRMVLLHTPAAMQPDPDDHLDRSERAVGVATASSWGMPPWIVASIGDRELDPRLPFGREVATTQLARALALAGTELHAHPALAALGLGPRELHRALRLSPMVRASVALLS